ncbi:hypothetical protein L1987_28495 [Smallanthus sonchifolius]|uniref:Uncharacterized protein n=1 Tax=Smallanthus sonchifolius TaxID=185202 RepID=A0ACB9HZ55_9ASTR|nr:hypothetical protein L1987_28495 [Smallanthus sonchifolius]
MAHEDEDDEIEQHLVDKIGRAIYLLDEQQQNLVTKFYSFKDEFTDLLNDLKRKTKPKPDMTDWWRIRRNNLYFLNNLVTEWQITKNQTSLSPKEIYESCEEIKRSLRKMKKEVEGDPEGSVTYHPPLQTSIFPRNKSEVYRWSSRHPPRKVHGLEHRVFFHNLTQKKLLGENWGEDLAYGLPKGCGGTVISSSRSKALLKQMLGNDVILQRVKTQTNEIIYEIFKDTVVGYDDDEREFPKFLEELKDELLKKCDGVPLAAKMFANIARQHPEVKLKPKPPPPAAPAPTGAGGSHEIKQVPAGGVEQKSKVKDALTPALV